MCRWVYMYRHICVHMYGQVYLHDAWACVYACMCMYSCICMWAYMYRHICMAHMYGTYVCMYAYMYVGIIL